MNDIARQLNLKIRQHKQELDAAVGKLQQLQLECGRRFPQGHDWTKPEYAPIIIEGFECGDEPGTMGSDYRPKTWIPRQETPRWKRTCANCGLVQETERTREDVMKIPEF